jgi:hypothetical protein
VGSIKSGVSQTRYRSDFKRTWVRLGERGRRDRPGARRGESLFSRTKLHLAIIQIGGGSARIESPGVYKLTALRMSVQSHFLKQTSYEQTITIGTLKMAKKWLSNDIRQHESLGL